MTCSDVMTKNPRCCVPEDSILRAAEIMRDEDVGPVPVVSDHSSNKIVGIITDRDIAVEVVATGRDPKSSKVGDVMSTDLITCSVDDDYSEALEAMAANQVRRIPVVNVDGSLAGIISQADVALQGDEEEVGEMVEGISEPGGHGLLRSRFSGRRRSSESSGFGANALLMGAACLSIGAGIMYLLDSNSGPDRRANLREKASSAFQKVRREAGDLYHQSEDMMAEHHID